MTIAAWGTHTFGVTEAMKDIMAQRDVVVLQNAEGVPPGINGAASWSDTHALAADIRARNAALREQDPTVPLVKIGIYAWGLANVQGDSPAYPWITADMCLHSTGGAPLWTQVGGTGPYFKLVNLGNPVWRDTLVNLWCEWLSDPDHPYDGVIFDHWYPDGLGGMVTEMAPGGTLEGGPGPLGWAWWFNVLAAFTSRLRWRLERAGKVVLVNGASLQPFDQNTVKGAALGNNYAGIADFASGVVAEHVHVAWANETSFFSTLAMLKQITDKRRIVFPYVQTNLFNSGNPDPYATYPQGIGVEQFFWAMAKLYEEPPYTMLGYHDGGAGPIAAKDSQPYVWDNPALLGVLDLGAPEGPYETNVPAGTAWRKFYGGMAVVNASGVTRSVPLSRSARLWHPTTGDMVYPPYFNASAKSGALLFYT